MKKKYQKPTIVSHVAHAAVDPSYWDDPMKHLKGAPTIKNMTKLYLKFQALCER